MNNNEFNKMDFYTINGIKIYTGLTDYNINLIDKNINYNKNRIQEYYKNDYNLHNKMYDFSLYENNNIFNIYKKYQNIQNDIFTPLISSTITVKGMFSNILFNEEDLITKLEQLNGGYILKICCNYGEIINKNPNYVYPEPKIRLSNRGRKPKIKKKSKRKLQGTGKYFSSQITFEIYNSDNNKIYKIKLFRNGGFQIPGVANPDISDLIKPINILKNYLLKYFGKDIKVEYLISVMRNYICKLKNDKYLIRLNEFENILKNNKKNNIKTNKMYKYINDNKTNIYETLNIDLKVIEYIKDYIGEVDNKIQLAEIQNNCERYFGLILKFNRPVYWKTNKKTTIKILKSGKINIDGSNSIKESIELYLWLINLFNSYKDKIIHDSTEEILLDSDTDYSIGSGYSIYDDL